MTEGGEANQIPITMIGDFGAMHLIFPSGEMPTRNALREVRQALDSLGLTADLAGTVEIVLAEALNNVVEHAYHPENPGVIEVLCKQEDERLYFTICDSGEALIDGVPEGIPADIAQPLEFLPEGGFGWFLIRELADTVSYFRLGQRNQLRLGFCIGSCSGRA